MERRRQAHGVTGIEPGGRTTESTAVHLTRPLRRYALYWRIGVPDVYRCSKAIASGGCRWGVDLQSTVPRLRRRLRRVAVL
jgi:hypothetical protein